ncbi:MAG: hypothetical protein NTW60_02020 [Candidatus Wolfebacteria bacterium]|nr:hypothetical protein [Candidatus Wolfebacteria bacterium]
MSLKLRRAIFYGFVILFILSGFIMVMYSRGWRINIGNCGNEINLVCEFAFQKTGAIYLETSPGGGTTIKINNELYEDKSNLLQSGTLITEFLPKSYRVEISKAGYFSWIKNMKVEPELVTDARDIALLPKQFQKENLPFPVIKSDKIIDANQSSQRIIAENSQSGIFYLYDSATPSTTININSSFKNLISGDSLISASFHPFDQNKIIAGGKNGLYIIDLLRLNAEVISKNRPAAWTAKNSGIYYLTKKSSGYSLYYSNLIVKNQDLIASIGNSSTTAILKLDASNSQSSIAILDDTNGLFLIDQSGNLKKISGNAADFAFSPDSRKIAYTDKNGGLDILFLEDWPVDNPKKAGDSVQLKLNSVPGKIAWHKDSYHLFLSYPQEIKFAEIDDRSPLNIYGLPLPVYSLNFYYDAESNSILWIKDKNFLRAKFQ